MTAAHPDPPAGRALRRVWRGWLALRFRLFQRGRHDRLVLEEVASLPILVLPGVFNPKLFWTGELLAQTLDDRIVPAGATVLDMGTGSGVGAVAAARWAGRVVAVDINPAAVRCARINALLNGVDERIEVREGDLFGAVRGDRFDLVLFNPPYYAGSPRTPLERAFRGAALAPRFAADLRGHLAEGGRALVVLSSSGEATVYLDALVGAGFEIRTLTERRLFGETLVAYHVT